MSLILHLSDLHLGEANAWERRTDDKVGLVDKEENARISVLGTSLQALKRHLDEAGEHLDAVVMSGDATSLYDEEGFARFAELMEEVKLVAADRVIAVPGNHDVDWTKDPDSDSKYELFLKYTRAKGMRTPLCGAGDFPDDPGATDARPIIELNDSLIVAVNSANWCGTQLAAAGGGTETHDIARVGEKQLDRLTDMVRDLDSAGKVRIAVLHHHLLPVTEDEEIKKFESFTNLARLRGWLREHRFHVVLHGHKHQPVLTWDHIYDLGMPDLAARRVLIVSAPMPSSWGSPVCRLIRVGEALGRKPVRHAPRVGVETIAAERHERPIQGDCVRIELDADKPTLAGLVAIDAETADAAYEQLAHRLDEHDGRLYNVTCVVRDASSAERPPTNFASTHQPSEWFEDAVAWWQKASPALVASGDAPFNHGERLYGSGTKSGALDLAAAQLGSTKATVFLVSPDELRPERSAPAFVLVQLALVADAEGERLDCIGYFRKQDLALWWPVNISELRTIQKYVLDLRGDAQLRAGRLVTIAAEGIRDNVLPQLAGTAVDRAVDLRPDELMQMAYGVTHPGEDNEAVLKLWTRAMKDIGSDKADFPSLGLARLIGHLKLFRQLSGDDKLRPLIRQLEGVRDRAHRARSEARTASDRERHSGELFELVGEVLETVDETLNSPQDQA